MNVSALVDDAATRFGDRVVLELGGRRLTFAELAELSCGGARVLVASGARHVAYLGVSGPGFALAMLSAARAGIPFTPVNYRLAPDQVVELVDRFSDPIVIADTAYGGIVVNHPVLDVAAFCDLAGAARAGELPVVAGEDPAVVLFTSGTTARPKAVMLRHQVMHAFLSRVAAVTPSQPGDTSLVTVPPYHVMGVTGVLASFCVGRRMVFLPTFTAPGWLELARAEGVTSGTLVPTMAARLVRHLDGRPGDVPTLRAIAYGGSRMPRSVVERMLRAFPATDFVNGYGLTETNAGITSLLPEEHREALASDDPSVAARLGSAGRAVTGTELQVRGPDGSVLGPGQTGMLWVRGPQVAGEYIGPGSTLDADGWFDTRDQAHLDADGYLFVHGRADDTIIRGGENIAPAEIEDVLDLHPAVHAVAVVGLPDEEWGERIAAVVVAREGTTADELTVFVRERLRGSRTPDEIIFRADLPYTDSGKVQRRVLVEQLRSEA